MNINEEFISPAAAKKTRNRDSLTAAKHEERVAKVSRMSGDCFLSLDGCRTRDDAKEIFQTNQIRRSAPMASYWSLNEIPADNVDYEATNDFHVMGPGVAAIRRKAIEYIFVHVYGSPSETTWKCLNLVRNICKILQIGYNSATAIRNIMSDIVSARTVYGCYSESKGLKGRGRKLLVQELDPCAHVVYHALGSGQSIQSATVMVNPFREQLPVPLPPISWSAVRSFVNKSKIIDTHRRQTKKSGKDDINTIWSVSREARVHRWRSS